ncbi:porin [Candidatus Pelagibacter sp. Uisw_090]|uniref:porin n=1 Tax=Candidatus Pelagibacter sp. Uisw_090 TaxID=3230993 RepID=UPI0039E762AE
MTNLKKIGLSALAGSLVAFSAQAGELSVSGGAKLTYTGDTGKNDAEADGNRFGMQQLMTFTGSGELDNGHTVSLYHAMTANGGKSSSSLTYDMGAMGAITYNQDSGDLGIGKIDDIMPTAEEEVWNGLDADSISDGTEGLNGRVDSGTTGFNYAYSVGDMANINVGYGVKTSDNSTDDGGNSGTGAVESATSIAVSMTPIDGLRIVAGTGERGVTASTSNDHTTYGFTYAFGPVTVGAQHSEIDSATANSDLETDMYGISFAINDNLSISYGSQETEKEGDTDEQDVTGMSIGYSMGGMSLKAHSNKAENIQQVAGIESEHTEISLSFAF